MIIEFYYLISFMSDFLSITEIYLDFYEDLNNRKNELDSYSYILSKIESNTYQDSAMIRSGIVAINSHYEWCIKKVFEQYLNFIFSAEIKNFQDILYYDTLEKINKWKIINNIKISKMKELMEWLWLSYERFIEKIHTDLLQKKFFIDEVKKTNYFRKFYVYESWKILNCEQTLIKIIDKTLIAERNSIWHWDLKKIDKKLFFILKSFNILYLWVFIAFIIENINNRSYLKTAT